MTALTAARAHGRTRSRQTDESEVVTFLLSTEIIPLCLRIMETGSDLSKTVATFIVQKILLDDLGLQYICQTYERFSHVALILVRAVSVLCRDIVSARGCVLGACVGPRHVLDLPADISLRAMAAC